MSTRLERIAFIGFDEAAMALVEGSDKQRADVLSTAWKPQSR